LNKHKFKGLAYAGLSCLGLGYEIVFVQPPRTFLLIMYSLVAVLALLFIFLIKEQ